MGQDVMPFTQTVLGSAFAKIFHEGPPIASDVIPAQALGLMLTSLDKLREAWEKASKATQIGEAAAASFQLMMGLSKKRRAEREDTVMRGAEAADEAAEL